jgi:hypothetical protein
MNSTEYEIIQKIWGALDHVCDGAKLEKHDLVREYPGQKKLIGILLDDLIFTMGDMMQEIADDLEEYEKDEK